jgi:hypothetical protein
VTVDAVWIGNRIYWTLQHTTRDYTVQITITHRLVFSVTVFTALLGSGFQQWTFLCSRPHVLAASNSGRSSAPGLTSSRLPTVDVRLLPGSRPRRLAAISHQTPALLTVFSGLYRNESESYTYYDRRSVGQSVLE